MTDIEKKQSLISLLQVHLTSANIGETAVLMAYYLLLSLFPLMIALGNILPIFNIDPTIVLSYLDEVAPEAVRSILDPVIEQLLTSGNGGLFSLGMLAVIWASSNGFGQLQKGLDRAYNITDKRHNIIQKAMSVLTVVAILIIVVTLIVVFGFGSALFDQLAVTLPALEQAATTLSDLKWSITIFVLFGIFLALYMWAPAAKVRFRDALPGTIFAIIGWMALVLTFSLYLQLTARSLSAYGVLSTFFVLMFWLNFACMIVLVGAVINATIFEYHQGELKMKEYPLSQKINDVFMGIIDKVVQRFTSR